MENIMAVIGGIFLISLIGSFWLDERPQPVAALKNLTTDKLIRFIGTVGLIAAILVGFGVGSWLLSALYWEAIVWVAGLLGIH